MQCHYSHRIHVVRPIVKCFGIKIGTIRPGQSVGFLIDTLPAGISVDLAVARSTHL